MFIISFFLHLPSRIPLLGTIRFDLLLILLIALIVIFNKKDVKKKEIINNTDKLLRILIIYALITLPFVRWPGSVLNTGIPNFIKAIIFYYFTISLVDTEKKLKVFMIIFIACQSFRVFEPLYLHITDGYWGSVTHMGGYEMMDRLAGAPHDIVNPNGLAFVIASVIPFFHYLGLSSSNKIKMLYLVSLPVFVYAMVLTASRTGFLALVVILAGIFLKSRRKMPYAAVALFAVMIILSNLSQIQKERYLSIARSDVRGAETARGRIEGVVDSFMVALKRPVIGHGLGTSVEATYHALGDALIAHNLYVEIMQELGLIGLIIFLFYIKSIILMFSKNMKRLKGRVEPNNYLLNLTHAMQVWLWMNLLFSLASYGLSSYEWYLFAGLSVVIRKLSVMKIDNGMMLSTVAMR
jgi:O-antigen ligase